MRRGSVEVGGLGRGGSEGHTHAGAGEGEAGDKAYSHIRLVGSYGPAKRGLQVLEFGLDYPIPESLVGAAQTLTGSLGKPNTMFGVTAGEGSRLACFGEAIEPVVADGLQQPEAGDRPAILDHQKRLVH